MKESVEIKFCRNTPVDDPWFFRINGIEDVDYFKKDSIATPPVLPFLGTRLGSNLSCNFLPRRVGGCRIRIVTHLAVFRQLNCVALLREQHTWVKLSVRQNFMWNYHFLL